MTFVGDGTYTSKTTEKDQATAESGTWKLDGSTMLITCTKGDKAAKIGKEHKLTVKVATDDKLILADGPGKEEEIEFAKVK